MASEARSWYLTYPTHLTYLSYPKYR